MIHLLLQWLDISWSIMPMIILAQLNCQHWTLHTLWTVCLQVWYTPSQCQLWVMLDKAEIIHQFSLVSWMFYCKDISLWESMCAHLMHDNWTKSDLNYSCISFNPISVAIPSLTCTDTLVTPEGSRMKAFMRAMTDIESTDLDSNTCMVDVVSSHPCNCTILLEETNTTDSRNQSCTGLSENSEFL